MFPPRLSHAEAASAEVPLALTRRFTTRDVHTVDMSIELARRPPAESMLRRQGPDPE